MEGKHFNKIKNQKYQVLQAMAKQSRTHCLNYSQKNKQKQIK